MQYSYYINLDEPDVRDVLEKMLFSISGHEIFEDGFMRDQEDTEGLEDYLSHLGIMDEEDSLVRRN